MKSHLYACDRVGCPEVKELAPDFPEPPAGWLSITAKHNLYFDGHFCSPECVVIHCQAWIAERDELFSRTNA